MITRLIAVLDAETQVFQVGINLADAAGLTGASAEQTVRRTADAGRYVPGRDGGQRPVGRAGLRTASLDEVLCITAVWRVPRD